MEISIEEVTNRVIEKLSLKLEASIDIEASGRHIHLSREHIEELFGIGYEIAPYRYLSQPGQFATKERLSLIGPRGVLHNVVVLGPERKKSQVEVSISDSRILGVDIPVRMSGEIKDSPGILLANGSKVISLDEGLIVAKRHIHLKDTEAERLHLKQNDRVQVKVLSERPVVFDDVAIRVSSEYENSMHIDYDEANACGLKKGTKGLIITQ